MRFKHIKKLIAEDELMEINMSPSSLKKLSSQIDALAGMEFEMCVPNAADADDQDPEPDYDSDERARSIDDVCDFFHDGDHNSRRTIDDLRRRMQNDFEEWADEQLMDDWSDQGLDVIYEYVKNNVDDDNIIDTLELEPDAEGNPHKVGREEWARYAELCMEVHSDIYDEAYEEFRDEWYNSDKEETWLEHEGMELMSDVENRYHITWPHWHNPGMNNQVDVEFVADDFQQAIGRKVNYSRNYHGGKREPNTYVVEPDSSIDVDDDEDGGLEFVSPPLPLNDLLSDLDKVKEWANRTGCYTNDSTGLHINVSVPNFDIANLDYVKLALLLGDEHILEVFGRSGNTYCKSAIGKVKDRVKKNPDTAEHLLNQMRNHMDQLATKAIHSGVTDKYTSINTKTGYIEFRSPGGDWLAKLNEGDEIQQTLLRFVVAMDAAMKPELYREEYLKKLYKVLDVKSEKDPLWYFVKYSAGGFSPTVLKSFIRQTQLERDIKRGKEKPQEELVAYEIYNRDSDEVVSTVLARNAQEALAELEQFRAEQVQAQGITVPQATATYGIRHAPIPGSTLDLQRQRQVQPQAQSGGNWGIWITSSNRFIRMTGTGDPSDRALRRFPSREAAEEFLAQTRAENPNMRTDIEIREIPADYQSPGQSAAAIPTVDIDVEPAPPPQLPGMGQWNGQWKVLVGGQEVYRFGGIGNSQADANRIAAAWLRQNGQGVSGEGFEVYPVMA